ncbi:MAG: nucleotidyltransferase [Deltaproteobacteria bacterium]|nr:nucleotidyltransferase [Deltaproteobacteria bacterium]
MASEDIRDFLTALSAAGVEFLVVGAHALAAHGRLRATGDLDVLIAANETNAARLEVSIREFAATSLEYFGVSVEELSEPQVGFYMGVEPDRIDVMTRIAGVAFDRAWRGRAAAEIEGIPVHVLGFDELIAAKQASAQRRTPGSVKAKQDEADLVWLLAERERRRSQ